MTYQNYYYTESEQYIAELFVGAQTGGGGNASPAVYNWIKKPNTKFLYIEAVSPGAGGGGGASQNSGTPAGGGGGGGGGVRVCHILPYHLIPPILKITVGAGGPGGSGQVNGGNPAKNGSSSSYANINFNNQNTLSSSFQFFSSNSAFAGTSGGIAGGLGGSTATDNGALLFSHYDRPAAATAGADGTTVANGNNILYYTGIPYLSQSQYVALGGAGGGGSNGTNAFAGGSIYLGNVDSNLFPGITGGFLSGGSPGFSGGNKGSDGLGFTTFPNRYINSVNTYFPSLMFLGGAGGGGCSGQGNGGDGGHGGPGCGGGGGGGTIGGVGYTGGRGGDGGPGYCLIISYT